MTLARRLIPCLDTDGSRVVKGPHFQNLSDSGDPAELAGRYAAEGADELAVMDTAAGRGERLVFLETIRRIAAQAPLPLMAGGGIHSVGHARAVLRAGADKVIVNTAALRQPQVLTQLSEEFGAQAVVLALDAKRRAQGAGWEVYARGGCEPAGRDAVEWARDGAELGAGEILLNSMDRQGTREGFDCALTAAVSSSVTVPVMASGGAGTPDDFLEVFTDGRAEAALATTIFREATVSIRSLKQYLDSRGLPIRL